MMSQKERGCMTAGSPRSPCMYSLGGAAFSKFDVRNLLSFPNFVLYRTTESRFRLEIVFTRFEGFKYKYN